jgi:CRP-like cAMP-binding protein
VSDLAAVAGTTRETLNKWLGIFAEQGLISWHDSRITVLEAERVDRHEE